MTDGPLAYRGWKKAMQTLTAPSTGQVDRLRNTDWDVLLVLDACRYDELADVAVWPVESVRSPASRTEEWIQECQPILDEAVTISANPIYGDRADIGLWATEWSERLQTVTPDAVLKQVSHARNGVPVVGHLLQPHWPPIAKSGDGWHRILDHNGKSEQQAMVTGELDPQAYLTAYRRCLRDVWLAVECNALKWAANGAHVVVTADHGETFGRAKDMGLFGHPRDIQAAPLTRVPWVEFTPENVDSDAVDQLEALGYFHT